MFVGVKVTPSVIAALGLHSLFLFHGAICAIAALFVWRLVPETRGKTLTELGQLYKTKSEEWSP